MKLSLIKNVLGLTLIALMSLPSAALGFVAAAGSPADEKPATPPASPPANPPATPPANPPAEQPPAPPTDPKVIEWLDKLEAAGQKIKSFQAAVHFRTFNFLTQDDQIRIGVVKYMSGKSARFLIDFDKRVVNSALRPAGMQWVFDGSWLVEKNVDKKVFIKRQIVEPGGSYDPIRLGSGPFPLPLGNKRAEVLSLFHVTLIAPDKNDPPNTFHLKLVSRKDQPVKRNVQKFESLDIWYDSTTLMPARVYAKDDSANEKTVNLTKIEVDKLPAADADKIFDTTPPKADSGWHVEIKPWKNERE